MADGMDFEQGGSVAFDHGHAVSFRASGQTLTWSRCRRGWRWSRDVGATLGLERCPVRHRLVLLEGRLRVLDADGTERTLTPGDVEEVPPGHDAWVEGDEDVVFVDAPAQ